MKQSRIQSLLVVSLLVAGSQLAMAETVEVSLGGVTYSLDSESQAAAVKSATDVSGDFVLPESVSYGDKAYALTSIGEEAFAECSDITSLSIPSGVTSIGVHAFYGCTSLTSVNIPSGVTSIEEGTFESCRKLASVDIPYGVTTIGHHAFFGCSKLESVTIPNSVDSIADMAFYTCRSLTSVDIPSSVKSIGEQAFYWCSHLTSVEIPFGVTSIGSEAFCGCRELASVSLPSSLTCIGSQAFYLCSITSITIPSSVAFIGEEAFNMCGSLESIVVEEGNKVYDSRDNCNAIIETATNKIVKACINSTIPYGIESIGKSAFSSLYYLTSIDIPSSVTSIEDKAFYFCTSLTSVTIPSSVTSIGVNPFDNCTGIQTFTVEDGNKFYDTRDGCNAIIETATGRLVSGCNTSTIPYGVTTIGENAFAGSWFSSIDIPSSVTSIGRAAFVGSSLTSVDIPSSVKSIGEVAFRVCNNLTSVTLRSSAISLEESAFDFSSIKDVYIYGSEMVENCGDNAFASIEDDATLHVDASLVDKYKATSPWCDWFADIVALDGETGIKKAEADTPSPCRIYSVDGKSLPTMRKGLNILRSKTGKSVKVVK